MSRNLTTALTLAAFLAAGVGASAASLTDEFDGGDLRAGWDWWQEPAEWDVGATKDGWLTIQADNNRNLWQGDTTTRLFQAVPDEPFDVETHLVAEFEANSIVAGLVATSVEDVNWVTLKLWGHADGTAQLQYQTKENENGGGRVGAAPGFASADGVVDLYMRLEKDTDNYTGSWKLAEGDDWTAIGPLEFPLTPPIELSLYAGVDGADGEMLAQFEYFRDNITPLDVEPTGKLATTWARVKAR
jgi:hypothetical protein